MHQRMTTALDIARMYDVPLSCLLPVEADGLIAVASMERGFSGKPDSDAGPDGARESDQREDHRAADY